MIGAKCFAPRSASVATVARAAARFGNGDTNALEKRKVESAMALSTSVGAAPRPPAPTPQPIGDTGRRSSAVQEHVTTGRTDPTSRKMRGSGGTRHQSLKPAEVLVQVRSRIRAPYVGVVLGETLTLSDDQQFGSHCVQMWGYRGPGRVVAE